MSETVLRVPFTEVKTFRVTCKSCKMVIEVPFAEIDNSKLKSCPFCRENWTMGESDNSLLYHLSKQLAVLESRKSGVTVEIVVSQD